MDTNKPRKTRISKLSKSDPVGIIAQGIERALNRAEGDYIVDDSPKMHRAAARMRARGLRAVRDAQPGSIAALAEATDAAIRAASPAPRAPHAKKAAKKNASDVTAKVAKDMKRALARQEKQWANAKNAAPETPQTYEPEAKWVIKKKNLGAFRETAEDAPTTAPAPKAAKKKVASLAKTIDAAITADKVDATTKPAKVDWLDTGLERTGALTVEGLSRAWIAHLEAGGKKTASTIASYKNDLSFAIDFYGPNRPVSAINAAAVNEFNESNGVTMLKTGYPKAQPTILKMRRAFRMALEWARENSVQES